MIKQTWNIDEEERNRILNLHESATNRQYLTLEQAVQPIATKTTTSSANTVFPTQNIGNQFKFGEYQSDVVKNSIEALKPKIEEFIKKSGGNEFIVNISAGESNVTNPKGFEKKGSLALVRANSVKQYFQISEFKAASAAAVLALKSYPDIPQKEELEYIAYKAQFLYGMNSIESKRIERLEKAIDLIDDYLDANRSAGLHSPDATETRVKIIKEITKLKEII